MAAIAVVRRILPLFRRRSPVFERRLYESQILKIRASNNLTRYHVIRQFSQQDDTQKTTHQESAHRQESAQQSEDDGADSAMSEDEIKQAVLSSALGFVQQHGWSTKAIVAGAESEGLPGVAHGLFPRGGIELVDYFYKDCNRRLADRLAAEAETRTRDGAKLSVTSFVREALEYRLRLIHPYIDHWSEAMGLQALPQNAVESWRNLLELMDDIWFYSGDKSTDFSWYTKRLSLAYVYKTTEIFMVQDKSDEYQDTWFFMSNRLNDVRSLGKTVYEGQKLAGYAFDLLKAASKVGVNISGMNRHEHRSR